MISITEKKWVQQKINKNLAEKVKQDYELTNFLSILSYLEITIHQKFFLSIIIKNYQIYL